MVPDAMVLELVGQWLDLHPDRFVFDGFPRTLVQADALENLLAQKGSVLDVALYFDLTLETIFERVMHRVTCSACGKSFAIGLHVDSSDSRCPECGSALIRRHDDTPEALEQRMAEYRSKTEPLVDYYRHRGLLWPLKAAEAPEVVFAEILSVLEVA